MLAGRGRQDCLRPVLADQFTKMRTFHCGARPAEEDRGGFIGLADNARSVKDDDSLADALEEAAVLELGQVRRPTLLLSLTPGDYLLVDAASDHRREQDYRCQLKRLARALRAAVPEEDVGHRQDRAPDGSGHRALPPEVEAGVEDREEVERGRQKIDRREAGGEQ